MRVGILGLHLESNTFVDRPTTLEDFRNVALLEGEAIRAEYATAHHEIGGFFEGLAEAGIDAVPVFFAAAVPGGPIEANAYDELLSRMFAALERAGPLDGLLASPHGAAVSERHADADGYWLARLRERTGAAKPIVCTLDLHANVSPRAIAACTATLAYRTNPHLDQRQTGLNAARLLARTLRGEVRPVQAAAFPPLAINIERQFTDQPPCRELYARADEQLRRQGLLANAVVLGFPYADVEAMGCAFVAVADGDAALARSAAEEMAAYAWERREDFVGRLIGIEDALAQARAAEGPVCLLDMGDNVGGGAPGDATWLARALHRERVASFACLNDPKSVERCAAAGVGARLRLSLGGKSGARQGTPLEVEAAVRKLGDGRFTEHAPRHGGRVHYEMGPVAAVETEGGLTVLLTSRRTPPFSLGPLTSTGLDPGRYRVLAAKGVHAPVAAYREVCRTFIRVSTPGSTDADMTRFEFQKRRKPLFPFERI